MILNRSDKEIKIKEKIMTTNKILHVNKKLIRNFKQKNQTDDLQKDKFGYIERKSLQWQRNNRKISA